MLLLYILMLWPLPTIVQHPLNMRIIHQEQDEYCLLYYVHDHLYDIIKNDTANVIGTVIEGGSYVLAHQLIPYCLRLLEKSNFVATYNNTFGLNYTFAALREKNISSEQLLSWSASIDLVERYEIFLNNISDVSSSFEKETFFYNCTSPWFGPFCRFTFNVSIEQSFEELVDLYFQRKSTLKTYDVATCYTHLTCETIAGCLDWREICDRKMDCFDGSDEHNCWQLEVNECAENEYRCHNGQCIPLEFFNDAPINPDCLDKTDERQFSSFVFGCSQDPAFRCEEHTCRPRLSEFPCGDGTCSWEFGFNCRNRDHFLHRDLCSRFIACFMKIESDLIKRWCQEFGKDSDYIKNNCLPLHEFSGGPILFGHVRLLYNTTERKFKIGEILTPDYICYNEELCENYLPATVQLNNLTCRRFHELGLKDAKRYSSLIDLTEDIRNKFHRCLGVANNSHYCHHSTMYHCLNSTKCISKHGLVDGIVDCPFNDDETFSGSCSLNNTHHRFACVVGDEIKCLAPLVVQDSITDCQNRSDERSKLDELRENRIYFQSICDDRLDMVPVSVDGHIETDETGCDIWPCNNTYTRCDGIWCCYNGADEINCPPSTCPEGEHSCVFPTDTSKISCLPIANASDGITDCLGATDERNDHRDMSRDAVLYSFKCWNDTSAIDPVHLCNNASKCRYNDDEIFCKNKNNFIGICSFRNKAVLTEVENYFCNFTAYVLIHDVIFFKLHNILTYPSSMLTYPTTSVQPFKKKVQSIQSSSVTSIEQNKAWHCNRGMPVYIQMTIDALELFCLCPPSYYGNQCQYQNQRVSLTLQIQAVSEWRNIFIFTVTLIDDQENIESHDYIEYLPSRDCQIKFNVYLLYSNRSKNSSKFYSVRIDAFNKMTLDYRARWLFPLLFSFLPVHRLAFLLRIPFLNAEPNQKCKVPCMYGQCFNYINDPRATFCRCFSGWTGVQCNIKYTCKCAPGSVCIADSICVCPLDRFGPQCYLRQSLCHSETCANDGQCIPGDERYVSFHQNKPICVCPDGYSGDRCEYTQKIQMEIWFHKTLTVPSSLLVHLITVQNKAEPTRTGLMKKIAFDQNSISFYTSIPFNIALAEIGKSYYLIILQEQKIVSATICTEIIPSHQCTSTLELFNQSILNLHLLKRIKLYHILCSDHRELVCFSDSIHICLCNRARQANCFAFNHTITYDCQGLSLCENGGKCFQDAVKCPTSSICACPDCYYGSRCQFSTKGSALSLDTILGYVIRTNTQINRQPIIVKVAIILTTIIFSVGLLSNLLSFVTFQSKKTRDVGCGLYLFISSIISILTLSILTIKFWILLTWQTSSIKNQSFLHVQCIMIDCFLRFLIASIDWLSACVAIERAVNVTSGVRFDKIKSKKLAKYIILIVFLLTISTHLYDPMHRKLINDSEEQRTWCVTEHLTSLRLFDLILNVIHFSVPVFINCISALVIIISAARTRSVVQKNLTYKQILHEQLKHHKHLLISPFILVLLALSRLIISFLFGCMKSARNPWFYLIGYYLSFVPPMLNFVIFVLPPKTYMKELKESLSRFACH